MSQYTKEEIHDNIDDLNKKLESLKFKNTQIVKKIVAIKDKIKYWEGLDDRQIKLF